MGQEEIIRQVLSTVTPAETEEVLARLISIESHGDRAELESEIASFLLDWFKGHGMECWTEEVLPNRPNVIARIAGSGRGHSLLFNGHTDTVPPYSMNLPFQSFKRNGRIYGRGSVDMKGPLAAMMSAMLAVNRSGIILAGDIYFAATVGEETYSPGAYHLSESGLQTDYAIVGEPTGLRVGIAHKGVAWYEAEFTGVSVHGSVPEQGINAIYRASRWIEYIQNRYIPMLKSRKHPLLGSPSINLGTIQGGTRPVIVPNRCTIGFERRLIPGETAESALDELKKTLEDIHQTDPDFEGEIRIMDNFHGVPHGPLQAPEQGSLARELMAARHAEIVDLGDEQDQTETADRPVGLQFWTDGALLQKCCKETVVCGPGHIGQAHSDEEYIEEEQLHGAYRLYVRAAFHLCLNPTGEEAEEGDQTA